MVKSEHIRTYQDELTCPYSECGSKAIRFIEIRKDLPNCQRYRCRKCGNPFTYDISGRADFNPYVPAKAVSLGEKPKRSSK